MRPGERAARAAAYERARPEILEHVPRTARRVLDLGCATGTTGAALKARQNVEVVGIELELDYAHEARTHLDRVFNTDAEPPPPDLEGGFDVLIAADILEHLRDPWSALRAYAQLLEPGATAIVSLPNVAHWSTYAHLARGSWPRRSEGSSTPPTCAGSRSTTRRNCSSRPASHLTRSSAAAGSTRAARASTCSPRRS